MTNLDRFREMDAYELAMYIKICPCEEKGIECDHDSCSQCREDWLYEEVQEDDRTVGILLESIQEGANIISEAVKRLKELLEGNEL